MVRVPVSRGLGTFGNVQVTYASKDMTAEKGRDYLPAMGVLILDSGVGIGFINVTILNDSDREFNEQFQLSLIGVSGKNFFV